MDAWVYLGHGHVFANAQTGNVVLCAIRLAEADYAAALRHVPPMVAFCSGIAASRLAGARLKRHAVNSRNARLLVEAVGLAALAVTAPRLTNHVVTAAVGFLAALQITSLSRIGGWSFNTGMTTGNLRGALSAASSAWIDPADTGRRDQAFALGWICAAFPLGAAAGAFAALHYGDAALVGAAAAVLAAVLVGRNVPDPATR